MYVITGGGSGIGKALALELADRGHQVMIIGRREALLQETCKLSSRIHYIAQDLTTETGFSEVLASLESKPKLTALINNAGIIQPITPLTEITRQDFRKVLATNLETPLFLTQALLPKLQGGRVLNIGSGAAYFPVAGWAAYCVSKSALSMLTRSWQLECHDPLFASVMPGIIDTEMQDVIRHSQSMEDEKLEFFKQLKQQNRLVSSATVAKFLAWMLLDTTPQAYCAEEWDIYSKSHHENWLPKGWQVPSWEL